MTITDVTFEKPLPCSCGAEIKHYSVGYGPRPYMIHCHSCKCDLHRVMPSGMGGTIDASIEAWTDYHKAVSYLKENKGIRSPTDNQIRERLYRVLKGWV